MKLLALAALAFVAGASAPAVPAFDHVVVVVFENKERGSILGSKSAPTFTAYAKRYANLTQYYAATHPSLPNYLALISGATRVNVNCTDCQFDATTLADTIEASGRSWKVYAEGLPSVGFLGAASGRYVKRHNPFMYFRSVVTSPGRLARVVPLPQLRTDLGAARLPHFAFVVPDLCNSMHDCPVRVGDAWLRRTVPPLLKLPRTVVFVVFDEGSTSVRGGGHIAALALGTAVRRGVRFRAVAGHYGLLRTVEDAWRLPRLGNSAQAKPIVGIWRDSAG